MKNHFNIFEIEEKFAVDLDLLEQKYFAFQKQFHPDKAGISEIEKSISINEAYDVLTNPLRRAAHILQLQGIDIEKDEKAPRPDLATLSEVLEMQEKIPEMSAEEKGNLKKELAQKIDLFFEELALELKNKEFDKAAQILIRIKYFDKTLKDLKKNF